MWSIDDDIFSNGCAVYDYPTPHIPDSDCVKIFFNLTHMETKEDTVKDQYRLVTYGGFKSQRSLYYCSRSLPYYP